MSSDEVRDPQSSPADSERVFAGRYRLEALLGGGGMAIVHRAFDRVLRRTIALKRPREERPDTFGRFLRGARAQARLQHQNICRVYEVGEPPGPPYIAMQYVEGSSLGDVAKEMGLEQKIRVLRDVALAVASAHEVGLIHRDLKPQNILVERGESGDWKAYVTDFGIAEEPGAERLAQAGEIAGTPHYMAPEQVLDRVVDERTDVHGLGATLFEVLTGAPPFRGATVSEVLRAVVEEEAPAPRSLVSTLPRDLETITRKCLQKEPAQRYPSARAFALDLERYLDGEPLSARPQGRWTRLRRAARRHRAATAAVGFAVLATASVAMGLELHDRAERTARVAALLAEGRTVLTAARRRWRDSDRLGDRAFARYRSGKWGRDAQALWEQALALRPDVDLAFDRASRAFETALTLDPAHPRARALLADSLFDHARWAERCRRTTEREELSLRLSAYDEQGVRRARLDANSSLDLVTDPPGLRVSLSRYRPDGRGRLREEPVGELGRTPLRGISLARGSYLLAVRGIGRAPVRYPLLVAPGERLRVAFHVPRAGQIPRGFVYVPPGRFLAGLGDERVRGRLGGPPLHVRRTGGYLIARTEVTVGQWIEFLESLPRPERRRRMPRADRIGADAVLLEQIAQHRWRYTFRPDGERRYRARTGEKLRYQRRERRRLQDWTRFPVTGVSLKDAQVYLAWLRRSGRLRGARLCTDAEWERAARGADGRVFPGGNRLEPDDANIDETYRRLDWGPDEVGSHPGSRSPFGVDDLSGNAMEWTVSWADPRRFVTRSGGYNWTAVGNYVTNPNELRASTRAPSLSFRVCAPAPGKP